MCAFRSCYEIFWPQSRGGGRSPPRPLVDPPLGPVHLPHLMLYITLYLLNGFRLISVRQQIRRPPTTCEICMRGFASQRGAGPTSGFSTTTANPGTSGRTRRLRNERQRRSTTAVAVQRVQCEWSPRRRWAAAGKIPCRRRSAIPSNVFGRLNGPLSAPGFLPLRNVSK